MNRYPCSGCGLHSCDGRCYLECEADYPPEEITPAPRKPYVMSDDFRAWLIQVDLRKDGGSVAA